MKMKNHEKKLAKALVAAIFGVGFVIPLMFSNIAEAANFGKGGTTQWLSNDVLNKTDATKWATTTGTADANYVVFHGVKFKIVAVEDASKGQNAKATLWSYDTSLSKAAYNSDGSWGSDKNKAYANSNLKTAMDNLYSTTFASDSRIQKVTLDGETVEGHTIAYQEKDNTNTIKSYVWAPSVQEVKNGGTWLFSSDDQRAVSNNSWFRSPNVQGSDSGYYAYILNGEGGFPDYVYSVQNSELLRPALQILNQISYVFTTNVTIPTNGVFTANGSGGTAKNYALNSSPTATFAPTKDSVTLDGIKIGITASTSDPTNYKVAGLLTEEANSAKNNTWANLNGPSAKSTKGISYMAQVSSNVLDLTNVAEGTDYNLKIFGLKTADTTVTQLASGAITGLSKGADGKIHMKVSSTLNNGVAITLKGGAVVDLAGAASNAITTGASTSGTLNLGKYSHTGTITNNGTLDVKADAAGGTLGSKVSGGTLQITGGLVKYTNANAIGAKTIVKNGAKLDPAANLLNADTTVESGGELYISTGTLGVDIKGAGTTYIKDLDNSAKAQTITVHSDRSIAGKLNGNGNTVDMTGDSALKTFTIGTLAGITNLKIDVDMSSFTADKLAVTNIGGATVNISGINITKDITPTTLELPKTENNKITYVTSTSGTATYKVNADDDGAIVLTNNYKYTFTKGTTAGTLNYKVEATDLTFKKFAEGTLPDYTTTDPATLSLTADLANTGTGINAITVGSNQSNNAITVNLNGHNLTSASDSTITISKDKTFNLNGGSETTAGTTDSKTGFSVASGGTLALAGNLVVNGTIANAATDGVTLAGTVNTKAAITGNGSLKINGGTLIADAGITQNAGITLTNATDKLIVGAANLLSDVTNAGTVELTDGTLAVGNTITGGNITIAGDVSVNASDLAGTTTIKDSKTLTLTGGDIIGQTLSGAGKVVINCTISADPDKFAQTGGLEVKDITDSLTLTGTDKVFGQTVSGAGKVVIDGTISADADKFTQTGGLEIKDNADILILTGTGKTLGQKVSGAGKVVIAGTISADADKFNQTGGLEVTNNLVFTSSGLNVSTVGGFTQTSGSNIAVDASKIEADKNDPAKAMFTGVDNASKLNVSAGNIILSGPVQDDKYYVLVAGTAINGGTVTENTLWKMKNIKFSDALITDYEIKYDTNTSSNPGSIALYVKGAVTNEEANTSGLAAVQQGNIAVAKEFTDEVANRLSFVYRPKLEQQNKLKARDVANTAKDDYKVEPVEQGKANELMPVQVADEDKYDKEVWASHIRTKETTEGMKLGAGLEGNNTAQYNGAVVGVDFYSSDKAIAGVAFSYTTGDIDSYSGNTSTRNKSKYYGLSFYDRVTNGNNALIYDIGYIKGDNDINQIYTGKETTADIRTDTYTAGVRYEAEFGTKESRVVPFASFRYMRQNNKDYTNSHGTRFESSNQNLYIPKVGIAWAGEFAMPKCEWTWRPSVEAGYVWNLGDRSVDGNIYSLTKVIGIEYDTVDKSSYYSKAGMEFINKNFTAGVFYRYLKGDAVRNNKWNINVSWAF